MQKAMPELWRAASDDLWRRTLSQIPSIYGRLVYLAQLRNPDSGAYEHHGLGRIFGEQEADRALRDSHVSSFRHWLELDLKAQETDLALYISALPTDRRSMIENWLRLAPYRNLIPFDAQESERMLFLCDLEALLNTLRNELVAGARGQTGSPLP